MTDRVPTILALDFDGVLCDGLIEYFQTAWRTYCQFWDPSAVAGPELAAIFYRLRPVIETGWEMPVLIRALLTGISEERILQDWLAIAHQILQENNLKAAEVGERLDRNRDEWIANDLEGWLSLHRFYPGVVERLQQLLADSVKVAIVTTKEGRFVRQLLQQEGVAMPENWIWGKEYKQPKHQILREFLAKFGDTSTIWFVEDRLKTLISVRQQPDLSNVQLFLADWGYNTQTERESVTQYPPIRPLSLSQFSQDFPTWLSTDF